MPSKLDPFRDYLVQRMFTNKVTNATVLYDEIRAKGYRGGLSILWEYLKPLRALVADDHPKVRFETNPGQQAQVDWAARLRTWFQAQPGSRRATASPS